MVPEQHNNQHDHRMMANQRGMGDRQRWNALYLVAAVAMIFMTLAVAMQPLFLRKILGVTLSSAGMINANVEVAAELLTLVAIGVLGVVSDRFGRIPVLVGGFLVGAVGGLLAPLSLELGTLFGIGGIAFYYFARLMMALGTSAVWPQLTTLAGDFTNQGNRARQMSNTTSMMTFGGALVFAVLLQIPYYVGVIPVMLGNGVLGILAAGLVRFLLVDVAQKRPHLNIPWREIGNLLAREPRLRVAFVTALFSRGDVAVISLFYMLWTVYFADLVGKSQDLAAAHAGAVIGFAGVLLVVTSIGWGVVIERLGRLNAIIAGMAISSIGFVMMSLVLNPFDGFVLVPMTLIALGQAGALLAPDVLAFDLAPLSLRGSIIGALNVISGIGIVVIFELGGWLFDSVAPYAPFVLVGVGNLLVMAYALFVSRSMGQPNDD